MEPFKNWLSETAAQKISVAFRVVHPSFDRRKFLAGYGTAIEPLGLKERMHVLKERLYQQLPQDPDDLFPLLVQSLKSPANPRGLEGFTVWPLTQIIAERGLDHFPLAMESLKAMTRVFTGEFAIRPLIIQHEKKALKLLSQWARDPDPHVRRLVSEGTRPLLPWGQKLPRFAEDPTLTWPLLEVLRLDESAYVRKSVANHINDLAKHHPDFVVKHLLAWQKAAPQHKELQQLIRHATRTLVKRGHGKALELHGVKAAKLTVSRVKIESPNLCLGQTLEVTLTIRNDEMQSVRCVVDHSLSLLRANGQCNEKVFKGCVLTLQAGEKRTINLKLPIKPVTTRRYYTGTHYWSPKVNGASQKPLRFHLQVPSND